MPVSLPCLEKVGHDLQEYLRGKAKVHIDGGVPEKQAYIKAAKELQEHSLNTVKDIYNQIGLKGYEKGEEPSKISVILPEENKAPNIIPLENEQNKSTEVHIPPETKIPESTEANKVREDAGQIPPEGGQGGETSGEEPIKGIKHAAMAETAQKAGLPPYEGHTPVSHPERLEAAKKAISENPNLANEIIEKVEKGENVTPQDNAVLAVYKGALDKELEANPSRELFDRISRLAKVLDPQGTYAGQLLESRKLVDFNEDNLSNFLLAKEAIQEVPLSDKQVKDETAKFTELKAAKDALAALEKADKEAYAKLVAELGVNKARAAARKASKKTHEEHIKDRKAIVQAAREALKKIRQDPNLKSTIPYAAELKALVPHVKEFMQDLLNEGIDKFDNIVSEIHAEFKDVLDSLRKSDIIDILAGVHDEKKERTRNEKASALRLLKREAELTRELAAARKGEQEAKNETVGVEKRRRIKELEDKIKEVKAANKVEVEPETPTEKQRDASEYDKLVRRINKLTDDIKNKRYAEEKKPEPAVRLSRKTIIAKDKVIELEDKIRRERAKEDYKKRSKWLRYYDKVMQFLGIRRIVQSALDISIPFRQGATLISPRRIDIWANSFAGMMKSIFNPKKFSRLMYDIRHSKDYHDMTEDGIVYNEMDAAKPEAHNEDFQKSFIYQIPIVREPLLASNRAADAFLNIARYEMYMKYKNNLERQGMTRQSDPKAYKFAAKWAMDMTGRGLVHKSIDNKYMSNILGNTFYGAKLMASRFNLLNPVTYFDPRIPKEVRYGAMKDMAAFTTTVIATGLGLMAVGGKVSLNPWDSDFLQVRFGDKVYDLSGGLAVYIRTFLRFVDAGYTKATGSKHDANKKVEDAAKSAVKFWRNKLSPNTAYGVDAFFGPSQPSKEFDPYGAVEIYPMYAGDAIKALKEDGATSLLTVLLPNLVGVGYGNYATRGTIDTDLDTILDRNMRSDEMNKETIFDFNKDGKQITSKQFDDFTKKRDAEIKKGITDLFNKGADIINENDEVVHIPYKKLSREQVIRETTNIKAAATRKVKEELFGKEEKSEERKAAEQELRELKNEGKEQ